MRELMQELKWYPEKQLKAFRFVLGLALMLHFFLLIPYSAEMFSSEGLFGVFGGAEGFAESIDLGVFSVSTNRWVVVGYLLSLTGASVLLLTGLHVQWVCVYIWLGLIALAARNPLYYDIDLEYLGWLLIAFALTKNNKMPQKLYWGAWLVLGFSYSVSGLHKLLNTHLWIEGEALATLLQVNMVSRFSFSAEFLEAVALPLRLVTWITLFGELLFLPMIFFRHTRLIAWLLATCGHFAIAVLTPLTELNLTILIFHFFVFDFRWLDEGASVADRLKSSFRLLQNRSV